jgi:Zn-dependent protease with chaperone function
MHPSRTFSILIGMGTLLALLLGTAAVRSVLAGSPIGLGEVDLVCLFLPTHADAGIHLLSYAFMGTTLLGTSFWFVSWRRQWTKTRSLTRNLALLYAPDTELESSARRLGLRDKVHLIDSEATLCFCAGFISPRIYLSRMMTEKLTPEELEALLLHEKYHLEHHDPLKVLLGRLVVSTLFFIPVLKDVLKRYLIEKEIAADRGAIQYQGHRRGLAGALQKLVQERSTASAESLAVGGEEALSHRIDYLMRHAPQQVHPIPLPRFLTSSLITAIILITILVPLPGSHPVNSSPGSTISSCLVQEVTL